MSHVHHRKPDGLGTDLISGGGARVFAGCKCFYVCKKTDTFFSGELHTNFFVSLKNGNIRFYRTPSLFCSLPFIVFSGSVMNIQIK